MAVTLTIGFRAPGFEYAYECAVFILAASWCWKRSGKGMKFFPGCPLAAIFAWGFFQLALSTTVYRYATLRSSLRFAAMAATAWLSFRLFGSVELRSKFLRAFVWFGAAVAAISILAYFTSPGKILWTFDSPYTDVFGPFLSRNNFAQFLELAMPAALWFAVREPTGNTIYSCLAAIMLSAGLVSASRAGSLLLVGEAIAVLWLCRKSPSARSKLLLFALSAILFAVIPGIGHLVDRFGAADPYQDRRELAHSALAMISSHPWTGFGLGTFPAVYPAYAEFDIGKSVEHAHNDWLEWTAEGGIAFGIVWFGLAIWSVLPAIRSVWGIGVLGCFLHGVVDYPFARLGVAAWIFVLLGMLAAEQSERTASS